MLAPSSAKQLRVLRRAARLLQACLDRPTALRWVATNAIAVAGGLLAGLAPLALKGLVDALGAPSGTPGSSSMLGFALAYLLCLVVCRGLVEVRPLFASATEQRLYGRMRCRFFNHTLHLPLSFHLNERAGAITHALQQGIAGYQIIMYSLVNSIVPVLVEAVTVTLVLLSLGQPLLTMVFAGAAILYGAAGLSRSRALGSAAANVSSAGADASSLVSEALTNVEPIKCFGVEARLVDDFARATSVLELRWSQLHGQRLRSGLGILAVFVTSMGASLACAMQALQEGTLTLGGFVLATLYMVQVLRPLDTLVAAVRDVTQGLTFVGPMLKILSMPAEASPDATTLPSAPGQVPARVPPSEPAPVNAVSSTLPREGSRPPRIQFKGVQLSFGSSPALFTNLKLDIAAGRSVAIVGTSGCGKSTLARLLLRLWTPDRGSILWDGRPIESLDVGVLRSRVSVVPQETVLFNRTVADNIAIGRPGATPSEIERAARLARLHELIEALPRGYETVIGERGMKLSGGERQRIAIARAILRDPLVYIFDEATSMLDSPTEQAILHNLREISAGKTTLVIAHRLCVLRYVDDIVMLEGGRITEQGNHVTLLAKGGAYAALWQAQHAETVK